MVLARGVVLGVMHQVSVVPGWGSWYILIVIPGVIYQVSVVPGGGSWYLLGVVPGVMVPGEFGTWLGVMVLAGCGPWCVGTR